MTIFKRRPVTPSPDAVARIREVERKRACEIVAANMKHSLGCGFPEYHCECVRGWILSQILYGDNVTKP